MSVDVREAVMPSLELVGEFLVLDAQQVEKSGLEIVHVNFVFDGIEANVVGCPVSDAGFDSSTRHPDGEGVGVVVAAPLFAISHLTLQEGRASEFSTPDHKGVIEEPSLFEILNESGGRLVGVAALVVEFGGERIVLVPTGMHQLDVAGAAFQETSGEKAVAGKGSRFLNLGAVEVESRFGFAGNVCQLGHAGLHAVGHLVLRDPGLNLWIAHGSMFFFVQGCDAVEHSTAKRRVDTPGIVEVKDRAGSRTKFDTLVSRREKSRRPVRVVKDLPAAGALGNRGHHDKSREILIHRSQTIGKPGSHSGP